MSQLRVLEKLLQAQKRTWEIVRMDSDDPVSFSGFERQTVARIINEIEDDLEVLAERWGLLVDSSVVRSIDRDDEEFFDNILEQQEMEDFAMDGELDNFDHSETL